MKTKKLRLATSNLIDLLYSKKCHGLKYLLLVLPFLLLMNNKSHAQTPNFAWATEGQGTGLDGGNAITVDLAGNVYTTGFFESTANFNHFGFTNLTASGKTDIFIQKTDASGNLVWAKSIGGTGYDEGKCIAVDSTGNVYVSGTFEATVDFDPGAGTSNLTQSTSFYIASFILKLNSAGNFVYVKQFGGVTASVEINKMLLDGSANIIASGAVVGTQDWDPGAGTATFTPVYQDAYILKLTSGGNFGYVKQITGANSMNYSETYGMSLDPSGNIVIAGFMEGTADFDPGAGTVNLSTSNPTFPNQYFVAKYSSAGNYIWAGLTGGVSTTTLWCSDLTTDAAGSIYITSMSFGGIIDFDPTAGVSNISTGNGTIWIQKLNSNGNFVWAKTLGQIGSYWKTLLHTDATNGLYLSGYFSGTKDFNPSASIFNQTSTPPPYGSNKNDCYLLKLDTAGNFNWALKYGGQFDDWLADFCLDASGNIYSTGTFIGEGDFNPGAGVTILFSQGSTDIFIQKLNNTGGFIWAYGIGSIPHCTITAVSKNVTSYLTSTGYFDGTFSKYVGSKGGNDIIVNLANTTGNSFGTAFYMGGPGSDAGTGVITDAANNIYLTGYFQLTADFAPTRLEPSSPLTSAGGKDIFILKINSSNKLVWVKRIGSVNDDESSAITLDNSGNLFVTGYFQNTVDFDPGSGTNNLISGGSMDGFVLKMDTAGNFIWAKKMSGVNIESGKDITVDGSGNIIATGYFNGTTDFDPSAAAFNLTSVGSLDAFILKLNSSGNFVWAKSFGSASNESGRCIITDGSDNIICAGGFEGTTDFDPNGGIFNITPPNNLGEIFLLQLTPAGTLSWATNMGGTGLDKVTGLTRDAIGNIYTTGSFIGTADLDPRPATTLNFTSNGASDVFINCFNPNANTFWTKTIGGIIYDEGCGIAIDNSLGVYVKGNFGATVDFDPNAGTFNLTSMGGYGMFAMKLTQSSPLPIELVSFAAKAIDNKEVVCQWTTASEINNDYFTIEHSKDGQHFEEAGTVNGSGNSSIALNYSFTYEHPYNGISYYRLKQTDFNGQFTRSQIVKVNIIKRDNNIFIPTLVENEISLHLNTTENNYAQICFMLVSADGKLIMQQTFSKEEMQKIDLRISRNNIASGMYCYRISSGAEILSAGKLVFK